ncbi:hypothetical protein OPQ81_002112 [Rhizoctonia solani]|nr:hypothetical protein OPQ81_002112 [Rhizoctonia solani]
MQMHCQEGIPGKYFAFSRNASPATTATATQTQAATETAAATASETVVATSTGDVAPTAAPTNNDSVNTCPPVATVTVTVDSSAPTATATGVVTSTAAAPPAATAVLANGNIDLGSCSDPTIKFGAGIEGRKETSFIPNNLKDFNHGSAQNSGIITQFICDTFVNSCKASQAAIATCKQAKDAAAAAGAKKGAAADAFNAAFGVKTNFAAIQALDDQGRAVA